MENEIVRLSERMRILWSGTKVPRKNTEERNKKNGDNMDSILWSLEWKNCTEVDTIGNLERVVSFELCSSVSFIVA